MHRPGRPGFSRCSAAGAACARGDLRSPTRCGSGSDSSQRCGRCSLRRTFASTSRHSVSPLCARCWLALSACAGGALSAELVTCAGRVVAMHDFSVPGPHVLNGIMDLAVSARQSGRLSIVYACLIVVAICLGLLLVWSAARLVAGGVPRRAFPCVADVLAAAVACLYSIFFSTPFAKAGWPVGICMRPTSLSGGRFAAGADAGGPVLCCLSAWSVCSHPFARRYQMPFSGGRLCGIGVNDAGRLSVQNGEVADCNCPHSIYFGISWVWVCNDRRLHDSMTIILR